MPGRPAADFDAAIRRIRELRVDVEVLENLKPCLASLGGLVPEARAEVQAAHDAVRLVGAVDTPSALGSSAIDPVNRPEAEDGLLRRLKGTHEAVMANLADVAASLEHTARVVGEVTRKYRTADERNRIGASEIEQPLRRRS